MTQDWTLREAIEYYQRQGAPGDQGMLVALLREVQEERGGVLPAADVPARLCYRNLLYTGVTRARKLCVLVGSARTERAMVENVRQNLRFSGLRYFLSPEHNG